MVRVITTGGTARVVLEGRTCGDETVSDVVAGVQRCAASGVEEFLIAVPETERSWIELLEQALIDTPDPLRIWVAIGDPIPDGEEDPHSG